MAEIWSPGTSFQDVWACQISALYHLHFQSYETFSGVNQCFIKKVQVAMHKIVSTIIEVLKTEWVI